MDGNHGKPRFKSINQPLLRQGKHRVFLWEPAELPLSEACLYPPTTALIRSVRYELFKSEPLLFHHRGAAKNLESPTGGGSPCHQTRPRLEWLNESEGSTSSSGRKTKGWKISRLSLAIRN